MRELVGLVALFGALLGIYFIWASGDRSGLLGLLLLTSAGLWVLSRQIQLLSQQISRLEGQLKASQNKPLAPPQ
jgi:hypothetical protein